MYSRETQPRHRSADSRRGLQTRRLPLGEMPSSCTVPDAQRRSPNPRNRLQRRRLRRRGRRIRRRPRRVLRLHPAAGSKYWADLGCTQCNPGCQLPCLRGGGGKGGIGAIVVVRTQRGRQASALPPDAHADENRQSSIPSQLMYLQAPSLSHAFLQSPSVEIPAFLAPRSSQRRLSLLGSVAFHTT